MSEQSGPITREQVERAIAKPRNIDYRELPLWWREWAPDYVIAAEAADDWDAERAALTRWRDELAAAEPVRRVARWDATRGAYVALDAHGTVCMITTERAQALAWGYEIEGGPEPVRDWKSDRALVLSRRSMADLVPHTSICMDNVPEYATHWHPEDIRRCEEVPDAPAVYAQHRARYAAALSAEEARRAAKAKPVDIGYVPTDRERYPERPAPRFKVGDRVTSGLGGPWKIGRVEWGRLVPEADCDEWVYHHASGNVSACESVLALAWTPTPASPPAPEVVDVPQPVVIRKRLAGSEHSAAWSSDEPDVVTLYIRSAGEDAPLALLRAMLAAIDARQGGAS